MNFFSFLFNKKKLLSLFVWSFFAFSGFKLLSVFIYLGKSIFGHLVFISVFYAFFFFLYFFMFRARFGVRLNYWQYLLSNILFLAMLSFFSYGYYMLIIINNYFYDTAFYIVLAISNLVIGSALFLFTLIKNP